MPRHRFKPQLASSTTSSWTPRSNAERRMRGVYGASSAQSGPHTSTHSAKPSGTEDVTEGDETDTAVQEGQSVMAILEKNGHIGCALYDPATCKMILMEDLRLPADPQKPMIDRLIDTSAIMEASEATTSLREGQYDVLSIVVRYGNPGIVLLSADARDGLRNAIEELASTAQFGIQIRSNEEFSPLFCQNVVQQLQIPIRNSSTSFSRDDAAAFAAQDSSHLDRNPCSTACAAAVIMHLQRVMAHMDLQRPPTEGSVADSTILAIEFITAHQSMMIDEAVAAALAITDRETHASVFSSRTKEGLSLVSLFSHGLSRPAKRTLNRWISFPSLSIDVLEDRLDAVQALIEHRTDNALTDIKAGLRGMPNFYSVAAAVIADNMTIGTWRGIRDFARRAANVAIGVHAFARRYPAGSSLERIAEAFDRDRLVFVSESIDTIIDFEESILTQSINIRHGLDDELDEWRRALAHLPTILGSWAQEFAETVSEECLEPFNLAFDYFPQIGYLVSLHRKDGFATDHTVVQAGEECHWTYHYSSETKAYFKNDYTRQLDVEIGDLHTMIVGREIEKVQCLHDEIVTHIGHMMHCADSLAELECLLSFASVAQSGRYVRPELNEMADLEVVEGRHPLQELIVDTFIPNDLHLTAGRGVGVEDEEIDREGSTQPKHEQNSILIVTGANACGKSTYLKQQALIVVMAQIGSFVPARYAKIGLVDRILARIQVDESINSASGSFQTDMKQVAMALDSSTERSLLLLDEMGKGTSPVDGVALFTATIRHLLRRGPHCPRTLAATHFHEAFHPDLLSPHLPITLTHMQILIQPEASERGTAVDDEDDNGNIVFLYKLRLGAELASHATQCAKLCGVPQPVIDRATYVANLSRQHQLATLELEILEDLSTIEEERRALVSGSETAGASSVDPHGQDAIDLTWAEQVLRRFVAWNIEADTACAADQGELPCLNVQDKLTAILKH